MAAKKSNPVDKFLKPKKILQYFDPKLQQHFQRLTPVERLKWLGDFQATYWAGVRHRIKK